jgi:putative hydrolase of the HAD superfamily
MLFWIFDLDNTLYQLKDNYSFNYNFIKKDYHLRYLLEKLPCKKDIFTNANHSHTNNTLKLLGLENIFGKIYSRDNIRALKPDILAFTTLTKLNNIKSSDKVVFFEDTIENLITAKSFGWITVLISKKKVLLDEIDFWFPNINMALEYFNNHIENR